MLKYDLIMVSVGRLDINKTNDKCRFIYSVNGITKSITFNNYRDAVMYQISYIRKQRNKK